MTAVSEQSDRWLVSRTAIYLIGVAVVAVAVQVTLTIRFVDVYDEGLTLYGSDEILRGRIPYRDFWSLYGPAAFYVLAGAFKAFGTSVLVERGLELLYRSAIVVLVFELARRLTTRQLAFCAAMAALAVLTAVGSYAAPLFPATAGALATVLIAEWSRRSRLPIVAWFVAGLATAVVASFRTDIGVYTFLACASGCVADRFFFASAGDQGTRTFVALLGGAVVGNLAWTVPLLIAVPLDDLWMDFVTIPFTIYAPNRSLPFPRTEVLREAMRGHVAALVAYLVYVPALTVGVLVVQRLRFPRLNRTIDRDRPRAYADPSAPLLAMVAVLTSLLILKGLVRASSVLHMAPALCSSFILLAVIARDFTSTRMRWLIASLAVLAGATVVFGNHGLNSRLRNFADPSLCDSSIVRLRCFRIDDDLRDVVEYVDRHTRPDDAIYLGSTHHDRLVWNSVSLYFLADRRSVTKWHDLHPGVQTTLQVQREMIATFSATPPTLVILDTSDVSVPEPNRSAVSSGVTLLDDWIRAHYKPVYEVGHFVVLKPVAVS